MATNIEAAAAAFVFSDGGCFRRWRWRRLFSATAVTVAVGSSSGSGGCFRQQQRQAAAVAFQRRRQISPRKRCRVTKNEEEFVCLI